MIESDAYFDSRAEALQELQRRKLNPTDDHVIVRCERTGYGNWRVCSIFADFAIDTLTDGPAPVSGLGLLQRKAAWAE